MLLPCFFCISNILRGGCPAPSSKLFKCCLLEELAGRIIKIWAWNSNSLLVLMCSLLSKWFFSSSSFTQVSVCAYKQGFIERKRCHPIWVICARKTRTQRETYTERGEKRGEEGTEREGRRGEARGGARDRQTDRKTDRHRELMRCLINVLRGGWQEWTFQIVIRSHADS